MPIYQNHIFLSYSHENNNDVNELYAILKSNFDLTVWKDTENIENFTIKDFVKANKAIKTSKLILCFISKDYLKSDYCFNQFKLALNFNKEIIIVMLEDVSFKGYIDDMFLKGKVISKMFKNKHKEMLWLGYHFEKLLEYISFALDMNLISSRDRKSSMSIFKYFENHGVSEKKSGYAHSRSEDYYSSTNLSSSSSCLHTRSELDQYKQFKSYKSLRVKASSHGRLTFIPKSNRLVLTDEFCREIKVLDLDGSLFKSLNPQDVLVRPYALCINSRDHIIIGDKGGEGIFVFDSRFDFVTHFGKNTKSTITYLCCDPKNSSLIYATHCNDNEVTVWNIDEQRIVSQAAIDKPEYIFIKKDKIYIISHASFEYIDSKKTIRIKSGSNCIYVLDKMSLNILQMITFDDWLQPAGLYVDSDDNILTTAYILDANKIKSESRYFIFIDTNGCLCEKLCLNDIKNFDDMIVQGNKAIFYVWQCLKIIEFK